MRSIPCPSIATKRESTRHREASSSFRAAQIFRQGPLDPILRANPFPAITDLLCRLEAANIGDLMRLGYDQGCKQIYPSAFQGQLEAHRTPRITRCFASRLTLSPGNLTSREKVVKKKRHRFPKLPLALPNSFTLPYVFHVLAGSYYPHSLSRYEANSACAEHHCLLGSTNPSPTTVHMNPCSTSVLKLSFVILPPPPRSAPGDVSVRRTPRASQQTPMPSNSLCIV